MKSESPPNSSDKTPYERFESLGKRLLAVPRSDVESAAQDWQSRKKRTRKVKPRPR